MLGAIIGDVVGSVYEFNNIKTKDFPLFRRGCRFTDDTVMTVATADALMNGGKKEDFIDAYRKWGTQYPYAGYGGRFRRWLVQGGREPYNSWGNGSAMRVSPCAWIDAQAQPGQECPESVIRLASASAEVTHNHPEGVKGAVETARATWIMLRARALTDDPNAVAEGKQLIRGQSGYDLSFTLDEIRPAYCFDVSCQGSVPQAIVAFLESTGFEDAIRNAISIGGDSDTIAAITGAIAEAAYGIPQWIADEALACLDAPLRDVCTRWREWVHERRAEAGAR